MNCNKNKITLLTNVPEKERQGDGMWPDGTVPGDPVCGSDPVPRALPEHEGEPVPSSAGAQHTIILLIFIIYIKEKPFLP